MTTPFLTYELLTPETADPVVIRIGEQLNIELYLHPIRMRPNYRKIKKALCGCWDGTGLVVEIPLRDWPAVKQAIRELNEHYKEKYMDEHEEIEYDTNLWGMKTVHKPQWGRDFIVLTRKKPKVEVEWRLATTVYKNEMAGPCGQGELYRVVQFRVTGSLNSEYVYSYRDKGLMAILTPHCTVSSFNLREPVNATDVLHIGLDARDKWSAPVLLPESVYSRLDDITKALEDRANGGKG